MLGQRPVGAGQTVTAQDRQGSLAHGGRLGAGVQLAIAGFLGEQSPQLGVTAARAASQRERACGADQQRGQAAGQHGGGIGVQMIASVSVSKAGKALDQLHASLERLAAAH